MIEALAPVLGAIADQEGAKKKFLLFLTAMGVVMTGALYLVEQGAWPWAVLLYILASIGFAGGNVFFVALIVVVARRENLDFVSALGFSLGFLGGGVVFAVNVAMTLWPQSFGLASAAEAVRVSFVMVALWWAGFSIPVMLFVHEPRAAASPLLAQWVVQGFRQLRTTFHEIRQLRVVFTFLIAYWCYIDAVDFFFCMEVVFGLSLGFDSNSLILVFFFLFFVGFFLVLV